MSTSGTPTTAPRARVNVGPSDQPVDAEQSARWGPILGTAGAPTVIYRLLGGQGTARSRIVINGMHLPAGWRYVEEVMLDAGSSCGEHHHHDTEELYYVYRGAGVMHINGTTVSLRVGDLMCVPLGSRHSVAAAPDQELAFLVVEVYPPGPPDGREAARLPVLAALEPHCDPTRILRARIDLAAYLASLWRGFELLKIPPGVRWTEPGSDADTVVMVVDGALGGQVGEVDVAGGRGWYAGLPAHTAWELTAGQDGAEVITVHVGNA